MRSRQSRIEPHSLLQGRHSLFCPIECQQHTSQFQMGSRGFWMAFQRALERNERFLGVSLPKQENAIVDGRIFVGRGIKLEPH